MKYSIEKEISIFAVSRAAKLCTLVQKEIIDNRAMQKKDDSPVTIADYGSQALVCQAIKKAFPDDVIIGEEDSSALRQPENNGRLQQVTHYVQKIHGSSSAKDICDWIDAANGKPTKRFWILDPIDGTRSFLTHGQYAIGLALVEDGDLKVSSLACPKLPFNNHCLNNKIGVIFSAVRNQGTRISPLGEDNFTSIKVTEEIERSKLRFTESLNTRHGDLRAQEQIADTFGISLPPIQMDSLVKYGIVARGDAAFYLRLPSPDAPAYIEKIWDHAPGALLVEEAGGRVTDTYGRPLDYCSDYQMTANHGVLVSNNLVHDALLAVLEACSRESGVLMIR